MYLGGQIGLQESKLTNAQVLSRIPLPSQHCGFAGLLEGVKMMFGVDHLQNEHHGGAKRGFTRFFSCRYRIGVNTPAFQAGHAGSNPAARSTVAVTVRHDIKFGEHGSENPRQGSPLRERWEELAHEFSRMMNVYNL